VPIGQSFVLAEAQDELEDVRGCIHTQSKFHVLCSSDRNERIHNPEVPILEGCDVVQTIVAILIHTIGNRIEFRSDHPEEISCHMIIWHNLNVGDERPTTALTHRRRRSLLWPPKVSKAKPIGCWS